MEQNTTTPNINPNAGKGLGVAGLVVGIITLIFSLIPCAGAWAIIPGVVAVVLSAISMKQAGAAGAPKGMAIAGLICAIIGILIACYWLYALFFLASEGFDRINEELERTGAMDSLNKAFEQLKEITDTMNTGNQ